MGEETPIVVDFGSSLIKAGKGGEDVPELVFPSVVGRPSKKKALFKKKTDDPEDGKDVYIGDDALTNRSKLTLSYPIEGGKWKEWDALEKIWDEIFVQLDVEASAQEVLLTEAPYLPKENRERFVATLFETYEVPGLNIVPASVCSLMSTGRTTGLAVDSGDSVTHVVPILESSPVSWAVNRMLLGGRDVTNYMARLLFERGYNFSSSADKESVREIKEKKALVSLDYHGDVAKQDTSEFDDDFLLPDGSRINLGTERFRAPEIMFSPQLVSLESDGLHSIAHKAAMACDIDMRTTLLANVVCTGGNTMFENFGDRLQTEILALAPTGLFGNVKVLSPPERKYSVWIGAAMLATLPSFQKLWITKETYEEEGYHYIHKRCFNCV